MRLLTGAGGTIADWPQFKSRLAREFRRWDFPEDGDDLPELGRPPSPSEIEEGWVSLAHKGYVALGYDRIELRRVSRREPGAEGVEEDLPEPEYGSSRLNLACDVLSCVFLLPGIFVNEVFGPFSLAFALAMTGSRRRWGVLRVTGAFMGSIAAVVFFVKLFL
jgi:hypothetical protein